jgi:hypothetical protein
MGLIYLTPFSFLLAIMLFLFHRIVKVLMQHLLVHLMFSTGGGWVPV